MGRLRRVSLLVVLVVALTGCRGETPATPTAGGSPTPGATTTATATMAGAQGSPTRGVATPATPGMPGTPGTPSGATRGDICAFEPPFGRQTTASARPSPTATAVGGTQPAGRVAAPRPGQEPPTIPLPNLSARYALTVEQFTFGVVRSEFRTAETIAVTNREACSLDRLTFSVTSARWGWFTLGGLRVGGQSVDARVDGTVLAVPLPQPLAPGATVEVGIDFQMSVGAPSDNYTLGGFAGTLQAGEILRLAYWFPILSDNHQYPPFLDPPYTASAEYDVTMTLPSDLVVAYTGVTSETRRNTDGTTTYRVRAENVRDFVVGMSPNYQVERRTTAGGVEIEMYYDPRSIDPNGRRPEFVRDRVETSLDAAVLATERLGDLIGPYPYPVLRMVDGGPTLLGGIEFPMLVAINFGIPGGLENLIYHEVAHEWFYGIIGTRTQQDPWIDEGAATFLAEYIEGTLDPTPPRASEFVYRLDTSVWAIPPGGFQSNAIESIYTQGGALYTRVLEEMGEEAFWRAMQRVYQGYRFGIVTPRVMLETWQEESPTDLRPLFTEYFDYPWIGELGR